ncbi:19479_t:CDS:2, partial [Racocetra fulgida]
QLLDIWGTAEDKTRIAAFLNIRKLASIAPPPFIDLCLKGIYTTFVQYCKETTVFTIPSINLMSNCAVEMYGIDLKSSYQSAFNYIRQLAIHLRNSTNNKNEKTGTFIPLAPYLFDILHSAEVYRKPKLATLKPLDFSSTLKTPKAYLHTKVYQIKRHIKNSKNTKFNKQLQQFIEKKAFLKNSDPDSTPLGGYVKATKKIKEQRQKLMDVVYMTFLMLHIFINKF